MRHLASSVKALLKLTSETTLPRYCRKLGRVDDGESAHRFESPKAFFQQQYFEALDVVHGELSRRCQQKNGLPIAASIEKLLLDAANHTLSVTCVLLEELNIILYPKEIDMTHLKTELQMLPDLVKAFNENTEPRICKVTNVRTLCKVMYKVSSSKKIFREVFKLIRTFFHYPSHHSNSWTKLFCIVAWLFPHVDQYLFYRDVWRHVYMRL